MQGLSSAELAALVALGWNVEHVMLRAAARILADYAMAIRRVKPASHVADDFDEFSTLCADAVDNPDGDGDGDRRLRLVT